MMDPFHFTPLRQHKSRPLASAEIPAKLASKLTPAQLELLEKHAKAHHDSRAHVVFIEKLMEQGKTFEQANELAGKPKH